MFTLFCLTFLPVLWSPAAAKTRVAWLNLIPPRQSTVLAIMEDGWNLYRFLDQIMIVKLKQQLPVGISLAPHSVRIEAFCISLCRTLQSALSS